MRFDLWSGNVKGIGGNPLPNQHRDGVRQLRRHLQTVAIGRDSSAVEGKGGSQHPAQAARTLPIFQAARPSLVIGPKRDMMVR